MCSDSSSATTKSDKKISEVADANGSHIYYSLPELDAGSTGNQNNKSETNSNEEINNSLQFMDDFEVLMPLKTNKSILLNNEHLESKLI